MTKMVLKQKKRENNTFSITEIVHFQRREIFVSINQA